MLKFAFEELPVAVIGGGPVGLAAAAHLLHRGIPVKLYEAGPSVGSHVRNWGHVQVFTPWRYCIDSASAALLERNGWRRPSDDDLPTGHEIVSDYLEPLAATPELSAVIETNARMTAISRNGIDKVVSRDRAAKPFVLQIETAGDVRTDLARAVIDASGTWSHPNPLGANGLPVAGEATYAGLVTYGIPDVLGRDRASYAGRTTLVVGAGHSAGNAILDLAKLAEEEPQTSLIWATRSSDHARIYSGGDADQLPARGSLGNRMRDLVASGRVQLVTGFAVNGLRKEAGQLIVDGTTPHGSDTIGPIDRLIAATGQRPDLSLTRELRVELDPWLECARSLGPLIDPNLHSCGSVPPHGHRELSHPEPGFYTVGIKSYGRAPTFLLLTGYEQVRSVVAAIAGDMTAADDVHLVLPETGICSVSTRNRSASGDCCSPAATTAVETCCGGPAPAASDTCCLDDAKAKASGKSGCGCGEAA